MSAPHSQIRLLPPISLCFGKMGVMRGQEENEKDHDHCSVSG